MVNIIYALHLTGFGELFESVCKGRVMAFEKIKGKGHMQRRHIAQGGRRKMYIRFAWLGVLWKRDTSHRQKTW